MIFKMSYSVYGVIVFFCLFINTVNCQQSGCERINILSDKDYKQLIASRNDIIDDLFDKDLRMAIIEIDNTLQNCLRKNDYCNEGSISCKKALAYIFLGENEIAEKLLIDAEKYKKTCISPNYIGYNISRVAYFLAENKNNEKAMIKTLNETIYYAKEMNDTIRLAYAYANQGSFYLSRHRYNLGIESALNAMDLMKSKNSPDFIFGIYAILANLYDGLHNYERVIEMCDKALQIEHENEGTNAANVYMSKGKALLKLKQFKQAETAFYKALELSVKLDNDESKSSAYMNLGNCFYNSGKYYDAITNYQNALEILKSLEFFKRSISCYRLIGNSYLALDSMNKAEIYYKLADKMRLEKKIKHDPDLVSNHNAKLYLKIHQPSLYDEIVKYENVQDSLLIDYHKMLNLDLLEKYQSNEKEAENQKLQLQKAILNQKVLQNDIDRIALLNKNQKLAIENFTANEKALEIESARKLLAMENKALFASEQLNKAERSTLLSEQKIKEITISQQRNLLYAAIISLGLISLLTFALFQQTRKRKTINNQLAYQKDQIQLLHQELNHRVKNNLSFMTSLLEMQGRRTQNIEAREILLETENRLGALSLVHSNLFKNEEDTTVNLAVYLEELVSQLERIFAIPDKELNFICEFIDHHVNAEDAMRLGLIVNELVTNSVKHAFAHVNDPQINIATSLDSTGKLTLAYKDNGPGHTHVTNLTTDETNAHLGTKLIGLLREQLKDRYTLIC